MITRKAAGGDRSRRGGAEADGQPGSFRLEGRDNGDGRPPACGGRPSVGSGGYSLPKFLISAGSFSLSSRGTSPLATLAFCTWCRIFSTTSGLASVVMSPGAAQLDAAAITRRVILRER